MSDVSHSNIGLLFICPACNHTNLGFGLEPYQCKECGREFEYISDTLELIGQVRKKIEEEQEQGQ
ncbi:MAG: hypothetical protein AAB669_03510 [Patescibacteria group bacterium]